MFSRLAFGVHSLNQLLFGFTIGIIIYYGVFHILEVNNWDTTEFFNKFSDNLLSNVMIFTLMILFNIFLILFNKHDMSKYDNILHERCPHKAISILKFDFSSNAGGFLIFLAIGSYFGIYSLVKHVNRESNNTSEDPIVRTLEYTELNNWNDLELKNVLIRVILFTLCSLPVLISDTLSNKHSMFTNFFLKIIIPNFIASFLIYYPAILIYIKNKIKYEGSGNMEENVIKSKDVVEEYKKVSIAEI